MKVFDEKQVWFVTGAQHLYGPKVLERVSRDSIEIVTGLNASDDICVPVVDHGTVKSADEILAVCQQANNDPACIGLILWMHTFSPAKMWIAGLTRLNKPFLHLHTQFNAQLPWKSIDMDFMNTNQSAHGCREFGFIGTRMNMNRKVVTGHWQSESVHRQIDDWCRAAVGVQEASQLKVARFGDNMREVAVTEGNKVSAQIQFGYEVHGYGLGELAECVADVQTNEVTALIDEYASCYRIATETLNNQDLLKVLQQEARLEIGMERFLTEKRANAFTNTFENLTGLTNLPGLATQRLMEKGFGYGGEGDWKTAAMTRIMKVMGLGKTGGTSFMEDYTYNFGQRSQALGAHMLEVCPSIAADRPSVEIHRHTIGCDCPVARMIFTAKPGPALNVSVIDLGSRYRMLVNTVDAVTPPQDLPNLPVAHALWEPHPSLELAATAWIYGGGAHHTVYSQAVSVEMLSDYAEICGIEMVLIDQQTDLRQYKMNLKHSSLYYQLNGPV